MDYNEFIRLAAANLPIPTLNIRPGRTEGFAKVDPKVHTYSEEPPVRQPLGRDYAYRYMMKQEEEIEEAPNNTLDDVEGLTSVAGTLPNPDEVFQEQLTEVYEIYSFDRKNVVDLLVNRYRQQILEFIESNSIVVIKGQTGCGKTTQVPQFILDNAAEANIHCNIVVTQPRRIATRSVAQRVAEERGWGLGTIVGYQIALERKASQDTRLLYCTTGVLLQQLIVAQSLSQYTHIIIDEVHERDQDTDFLLILIKLFLRRTRCRTKIILMSATIHTDKFVDYFSKKVKGVLIEPPVVHLKHHVKFPVKIYYLEDLQAGKIPIVIPDTNIDSPCIDKHMYNLACSLVEVFHSIDKHEHTDDFIGSVLIFLPGIHEIEVLFEALKKREEEREDQTEKWWLCPMHSSVTNAEQAKVFYDPPPDHRKIILATNICESSITVKDVKYVIDFCLMKYQVQEVDTSYSSLQLGWMSKSQGQQRAGRVGRVMPGRVYRLIKKSIYEMFEDNSCPEMLRCPLDQLVLKAKRVAPESPPAEILANALEPPDLSNILRTIVNLKELGALMVTSGGRYIEDNGDLTFIGHVMGSLPLDVLLSKLIIIGHMFGLLTECITMACAISVRGIFSTPFKEQLAAYNNKILWSDCCDPIAFLIAYQVWRHKTQAGYFERCSGNKEEEIARRYFIQPKAMGEMARLEKEVTVRLKGHNIESQTSAIKWNEVEKALILKVILAGAFYPNYFVRCQPDEKEAVKVLGGRNPFTTVYLTNMPMDQPGRLYASSIRKHFKHCGAEFKVSFDGSSKVYIEFESCSETDIKDDDNDYRNVKAGRIPIAVYRAVKLRHIQKNIPIPILPAQKARERARELLGELDGPLHFKSPQKQENHCHRSYLPGPTTEFMNVIASHIETPTKFWVQINDEGISRKLEWIYQLLNVNKGEALVKLTGPAIVGSIVAAPFSENRSSNVSYYRARVKFVGLSDNIQVYFIDYGNTNWVHKRDIREFGPGLLKAGLKEESELALECTLTEVQPSSLLLSNENWSPKAIDQFKSYCRQPVCVKIYSVVDDVMSVTLFRNIDIEQSESSDFFPFEKSVNALLIKKEFAERCDEPYLSRENYMLRETIRKRPDQGPSFFISSSASSTHGDVKSPSDFECNHKALLKGPRNPLEIKLFCLTRKCLGKEVNVEWNSVNSVLLDTDPMDPHERLLVAATVTQNPTGERLTLRNTTMLPNIHGLLATVAMIFSPRCELRPNVTRTRLNGVLCGLGYDPDTKQSYNPENDMEINFDTVFSLEDLEQINKLRFYMNQVIYGGSDWEKEINSTNVQVAQKKVSVLIKKILLKKRPSQGVQSCTSFRWGELDEAEMLCPTSSDIETPSIYPLIWGIELTEDHMTVQKESCLKKLNLLAEGKEIMKSSIKCLLCEVLLDDVSSIKHHLNTSLHRELLSSFKTTSNL